MGKIIAVTDRKLCRRPFLDQIRIVAGSKPDAIILREKDLAEREYEDLAFQVKKICEEFQVKCILHTYIDAAVKLGCGNIHLSLPDFIRRKVEIAQIGFVELGVSVHSVEEAVTAQDLGATYITVGHIFETDCKKGVKPRGLKFLREVCGTVTIPVYAIGGIHPDNMGQPLKDGAAGVCMMSEFMRMD